LRCKHCYVFSDQRAPGKISLSQVSHYLNDGRNLPDLKWIYFGGGEPFTQYPLLLKAVLRQMGTSPEPNLPDYAF
jgi:MoaA/NifB/PqqE/SkfB family radical SAM enzyme